MMCCIREGEVKGGCALDYGRVQGQRQCDGTVTSKGFLSGMTSTLATSAFLAAGAGAGVPQENGSFLVVDVLAPHELNRSLLDVVPDAGVLKLKGSLLGAGAEVPQPLLLELVPKKSVVVLCLVFPEEANGSLVPPQFVVVEVPKGSVVLLVVVLANGSFVLLLANGSLVLVEANGSLELLLSQLLNPVEAGAGAGAGVSKPKPPDPPDVPNPPDCCDPFFQLKKRFISKLKLFPLFPPLVVSKPDVPLPPHDEPPLAPHELLPEFPLVPKPPLLLLLLPQGSLVLLPNGSELLLLNQSPIAAYSLLASIQNRRNAILVDDTRRQYTRSYGIRASTHKYDV